MENQGDVYLRKMDCEHPESVKHALFRFGWTTTSAGWSLAILAQDIGWRVFWSLVSITGMIIFGFNLHRLGHDYYSHAVAVNIKVHFRYLEHKLVFD